MLNTNKLQRIKEARKEHAVKLGFESKLRKKIAPVFRSYSKEFHSAIVQSGALASIDVLQQNMKDTLSKHYDTVSQSFSQKIVNKLGKPENHALILDSINTANSVHNELRAATSSDIIAQTTIKDANNAIHLVRQKAIALGQTLSNETLANKARLILNQKIVARMNTIAASETQDPAENAKQTEIDFLNHHDAEIDGEKISEHQQQKEWIAILDNVTRIGHAEADGQIVPVDQPYEVGGQMMMRPGDLSLGATIDNIINCRCSSIPIIR